MGYIFNKKSDLVVDFGKIKYVNGLMFEQQRDGFFSPPLMLTYFTYLRTSILRRS